MDEEPYPMIDELMKIEEKYLRYERKEGLTGRLQKSLGRTLRKKGTKYDLPFSPYDENEVIRIIPLIIQEYNLTPLEIINIIQEYSNLDHWRIKRLLNHFEKIRKLRMKSNVRSFVPGIKEKIYRPPDEHDSEDKGGIMYQKIAKKYQGGKKIKRKKKSNKRKTNKRRTNKRKTNKKKLNKRKTRSSKMK